MAEVPGSLRELAGQIGCSAQTIANWRSGLKVPDAHYRTLIEGAWGIPPEAWAVAPHTPMRKGSLSDPVIPQGSSPANGKQPSSGPMPTTLDGCLELLVQLRTDRQREGLLPADRLRAADTEARILALRHRLEKEQELLESRLVLEHPSWHMFKRRLLKALKPFPDAARAVAAELSEIEYPTSRSDTGEAIGSAAGSTRSAVNA